MLWSPLGSSFCLNLSCVCCHLIMYASFYKNCVFIIGFWMHSCITKFTTTNLPPGLLLKLLINFFFLSWHFFYCESFAVTCVFSYKKSDKEYLCLMCLLAYMVPCKTCTSIFSCCILKLNQLTVVHSERREKNI